MKLDLSKELDLKKSEAYFGKLKDQGARIEIKKINPPRSINQNSYMHVCFSILSMESGYTIPELKEIMANMIGDFMQYKRGKHTFRTSTRDLTTEQANYLIEYLRQFSLDQLGIYIPNSEEYKMNKFDIDKRVERYG